eukprot:sb/3470152/
MKNMVTFVSYKTLLYAPGLRVAAERSEVARSEVAPRLRVAWRHSHLVRSPHQVCLYLQISSLYLIRNWRYFHNGFRTVTHLDSNSKVSYCPKIGVDLFFSGDFLSAFFRLFTRTKRRTKSRISTFLADRNSPLLPQLEQCLIVGRTENHLIRTITHLNSTFLKVSYSPKFSSSSSSYRPFDFLSGTLHNEQNRVRLKNDSYLKSDFMSPSA